VLPQSLPDEHPLVVQPEPEPEPEPTLEEATGTLLDHLSVRCGREVRMSVYRLRGFAGVLRCCAVRVVTRACSVWLGAQAIRGILGALRAYSRLLY
jgi:hypothetical protein